MFRKFQLACVCLVVSTSVAYGQEAAPAVSTDPVDSAALNTVTTYAMKSGKLSLSSAANPKPSFLPDGTYTNDGGTVLVIVDGLIVKLERDGGEATPIESVRLNRDRAVMLTPSTNALMQVTDIRLPSGTFRSADGKSWVSVIQGRPTSFMIPADH